MRPSSVAVDVDAHGSPCSRVWDWIEKKKFKTKAEALAFAKGANEHVFDCIENYPWEDEFDQKVGELRQQGLSRNLISRELHASHDRVQRSLDKQKISARLGFRAVVIKGIRFLRDLREKIK